MPLTTKQKNDMRVEIQHRHPKLQKYFIDLLVDYYDQYGNEGFKKLIEEDKKRIAKAKKEGKDLNAPVSLEPIVIQNVELADSMPEAPENEVEVVRGKIVEVEDVTEDAPKA